MLSFRLLLPLFLFFSACDGSGRGDMADMPSGTDTLPRPVGDQPEVSYTEYASEAYHFAIERPQSWTVKERNYGGNLAYVNLLSEWETLEDTTITVHAPAELSHVTLFPNGYGTEYPNGRMISLREYEGDAPVNFALDPEESKVFMLDNGEVWAYLLRPQSPPPGWQQSGFIFAQAAIDNFRTACFDRQTGQEKSQQACDAMRDSVVYYGNVDTRAKRIVRNMLESLSFFESQNDRPLIGNLIRVEQPAEGAVISSPLTVSGRARGTFYFEASFSVELTDGEGNLLAQAPVQAQGEWMTENWVPFEATLEFTPPARGGQGYLKFVKANPSGLPQQERVYRMPVRFGE